MRVAASEDDIIRDESERNNLQRAVADLETAIAVSNPGTRRILEASLDGVKARVSTLDRKIETAKVEHAAEVQAQAAAAAVLAAKETALNAKERETYKGFLEESYFTKKDFGKLDTFYTHSYDRLSEGGKDEMSKRIDEGIRRGEFKAADLPESVQKLENARSHKHLLMQTKEHVGRLSDDVEQVDPQRENDNAKGKPPMRNPVEASATSAIDLSSVNLKGVKLVLATLQPAAAMIPDASSPSGNARS